MQAGLSAAICSFVCYCFFSCSIIFFLGRSRRRDGRPAQGGAEHQRTVRDGGVEKTPPVEVRWPRAPKGLFPAKLGQRLSEPGAPTTTTTTIHGHGHPSLQLKTDFVPATPRAVLRFILLSNTTTQHEASSTFGLWRRWSRKTPVQRTSLREVAPCNVIAEQRVMALQVFSHRQITFYYSDVDVFPKNVHSKCV